MDRRVSCLPAGMTIFEHVGKVAVTVGKAVGWRAGEQNLAPRKLGLGAPTLEVTSRDFTFGALLPRSATVDGAGTPPVLAWSEVPPGTRSIAVVVEDPDAPIPEPFVHWLVYGLAPTTNTLEPAHVTYEGVNSKLELGFTPAAPPPGHGLHHYHFQIFALDTELPVRPNAGRSALFTAMRHHVLAWGETIGTYERN